MNITRVPRSVGTHQPPSHRDSTISFQKRKPSSTLAPSDSQNKKHRGTNATQSGTDDGLMATIASSSESVVINHVPARNSFSEPTTLTTAASKPVLGALDIIEHANKDTAVADPVRETPATTPTRLSGTISSIAVLESGAEALFISEQPVTVTPQKLSTSNFDPGPRDPGDSKSLNARGANKVGQHMASQASHNSDASNSIVQVDAPVMGAVIRNELYGGVFLYEPFLDEFLPNVEHYQTSVQAQIDSPYLQFEHSQWTFDNTCFTLGDEAQVYQPLADLLNAIGVAAYAVYSETGGDHFRSVYRPFSDHHAACADYDYPSDTKTQPDLVKALREDQNARATKRAQHGAHWGDVELAIECKSTSDTSLQNKAYLQLARYARAMFSHQIYRLHIFGIAVCGPIVTFVRFDRSGMLHSPALDLTNGIDADLFVRKIISLLTLSARNFGYDPWYTFERDNEGRLETLFALEHHPPRVVISLLCHRKCCRGRATIASCLAAPRPGFEEVGSAQAEQFLNQEIVHKRIWRISERADEGTTLGRFTGVFGVCQVIEFRDGVHTTAVQDTNSLKHSPASSFFIPTKVPDTAMSAKSSNNATPTSNKTNWLTSSVNQSIVVEAMKSQASVSGRSNSVILQSGVSDRPEPPTSTMIPREVRVVSDLLMPKGRSLFEAQNPLHVLYAIHDALLGIAAFAEAGMVHCDISAYNILLVNPRTHYLGTNYDWNASVVGSLGDIVWDSLSSKPLPDKDSTSADAATTDGQLTKRQELVEYLQRGPYSVVCDAEYAVKEKRQSEEVHCDRTGTPAFISAQLLLGPSDKQAPVVRTFIHDIESLMWVLVWIVIHENPGEITETAQRFAKALSQPDLIAVGDFKLSAIMGYTKFVQDIKSFGNSWSTTLAPVIEDMARFFSRFLYPANNSPIEPMTQDPSIQDSRFRHRNAGKPDAVKQQALREHAEYASESRWETLLYFRTTLADGINNLIKEGYKIDLEAV